MHGLRTSVSRFVASTSPSNLAPSVYGCHARADGSFLILESEEEDVTMRHWTFPDLVRQDRRKAAAGPRVRWCGRRSRRREIRDVRRPPPGDGTGGLDVATLTSPKSAELRIAWAITRVAAAVVLLLAIVAPPSARAQADVKAVPDFGVNVYPGILTIDEGVTAEFSVGVSGWPSADGSVEVNLNPHAQARFTIAPTLLRISPGTNHLRQWVTVWALHDDRGLPAELTVATTLSGDPARVVATFCMTPLGMGLSELSDYQLARVFRDAVPHAALPNPSDGVFEYRRVPVEVGGCNGGRGARMTGRYLPDLTYLVRARARRGSEWMVSSLVTVRTHDPSAGLTAIFHRLRNSSRGCCERR